MYVSLTAEMSVLYLLWVLEMIAVHLSGFKLLSSRVFTFLNPRFMIHVPVPTAILNNQISGVRKIFTAYFLLPP